MAQEGAEENPDNNEDFPDDIVGEVKGKDQELSEQPRKNFEVHD